MLQIDKKEFVKICVIRGYFTSIPTRKKIKKKL